MLRSRFSHLPAACALFLGVVGCLTAGTSQQALAQADFFSVGNEADQELDLDSAAQVDPALQSLEGEQNFSFEQTREEVEEKARRDAFDAALQGLLPLRPNEIRELLERFDRTQESAALPVYPAPKPEVAVETLAIDPGTTPTVIKVAYGHVTTLNVLDISGSPWPIEDISWAGDFEVVESGGEGSHIVRISPQSEFAQGNMSIRLLTLKTPIIVTLETNREIVHYRFDALVPQMGPMADVPLIDRGINISAGNTEIAGILQGVIPSSAEKLQVTGVDSRTSAYNLGGKTYVRTPFTLLSPSWSASVASADGTNVYSIAETPVLLLSDGGKMVRARLSQREDILDEQ